MASSGISGNGVRDIAAFIVGRLLVGIDGAVGIGSTVMMCTSIRHDSESDLYECRQHLRDSCETTDGYKYIKQVKTLYLIGGK